ncbi:hypothetical protein Tco_1362072 [Tanacetum coccineum]
MPPKRTSTSEAPGMTQAAIRKLVAACYQHNDLEAQDATMANADNTNRNTGEREAPIARKYSYKEFMSCQPINFKGSEERVWNLLCCLSELNQCFPIEKAYKITWVEFKKLLIKKYCPRTEVQKMEDEFYHLTGMGNESQGLCEKIQGIGNLMSHYGARF